MTTGEGGDGNLGRLDSTLLEPAALPAAEAYCAACLSLSVYPYLTDEELQYTVDALRAPSTK